MTRIAAITTACVIDPMVEGRAVCATKRHNGQPEQGPEAPV